MWNFVKEMRQNHALEHATLHILSRDHPSQRLVGRSTPSGFILYGRVSTQQVVAAVAEALARLRAGQADLAVHPRCGTNLVVTGLVVGAVAFLASLGRPRSRLDRLPLVLLAATVGAIVAQPLGYHAQRHVTTRAEVSGRAIRGVKRTQQGRIVRHAVEVGWE